MQLLFDFLAAKGFEGKRKYFNRKFKRELFEININKLILKILKVLSKKTLIFYTSWHFPYSYIFCLVYFILNFLYSFWIN